MSDEEGRDGSPDPFESTVFDEAFVKDASLREETADERIQRWQRVETEHRRIIDEARERPYAAGRVPGASVVPRRAKRRPWAILVVAALAATFFWVRAREGERDESASQPGSAVERPGAVDERPTPATVRVEGGQPPPGVDAQARPIGQPAPLPAESGPFQFVLTQANGTDPVAYDPCRPIRVVVNPRTAPSGGDELLEQALARVSEATGLQFILDGSTDEAPTTDRRPYQPERYAGRWAPVLVAWSDPSESAALAGTIAGEGGSAGLTLGGGGSVYVTGRVVLDGPQLAEVLDGPNGRVHARSIIQHELGHLVGLDHVDDATQLMYPEGSQDVTDFGAGDRRGLVALGNGRCFPNV